MNTGITARFFLTSLLKILLIFAGVFLCYFPIGNTDIWWHMASAKEMVNQGVFLYHDPFTWAPAAEIWNGGWVNVHWLFQFLTYALYLIGGFPLLLGIKLCLTAVLFGLLLSLQPKRKIEGQFPWTAILLSILLVFLNRYLLLLRPILFSLIFLLMFFRVLWKSNAVEQRSFTVPQWIGLGVTSVLWANMQGLFILGPMVLACFVVPAFLTDIRSGRVSSKHVLFYLSPVLSFLAAVISPNGWSMLRYPFLLSQRIDPGGGNVFSWNIQENQSFLQLFHSGEYGAMVTPVLGVLLIALQLRSKNTPLVLLNLSFTVLAFMAHRNHLLLTFILLSQMGFVQTWISRNSLTHWIGKGFHTLPALHLICTVLLLIPLVLHLQQLKLSGFTSVMEQRYPAQATAMLSTVPQKGKLFHSARDGGYLNFQYYPNEKSMLDGRFILRDSRFFSEYLGFLDQPETFLEYAQRENIDRVLLPTALYPRYHRLAAFLVQSSEFEPIFWDGYYMILRNREAFKEVPVESGDSVLSQAYIQKMVQQRIHRTAHWYKKQPETVRYQTKEAIFYVVKTLKHLEKKELALPLIWEHLSESNAEEYYHSIGED